LTLVAVGFDIFYTKTDISVHLRTYHKPDLVESLVVTGRVTQLDESL
jgi:hypothetical protein